LVASVTNAGSAAISRARARARSHYIGRHFRDHTAPSGLADVEHRTGQAQLARQPGGQGRPRRRVCGRDAESRRLREADRRLRPRDPKVAKQRQREAARQRRSVQRRDQRLRERADRGEGPEARRDQALAVRPIASELVPVHA